MYHLELWTSLIQPAFTSKKSPEFLGGNKTYQSRGNMLLTAKLAFVNRMVTKSCGGHVLEEYVLLKYFSQSWVWWYMSIVSNSEDEARLSVANQGNIRTLTQKKKKVHKLPRPQNLLSCRKSLLRHIMFKSFCFHGARDLSLTLVRQVPFYWAISHPQQGNYCSEEKTLSPTGPTCNYPQYLVVISFQLPTTYYGNCFRFLYTNFNNIKMLLIPQKSSVLCLSKVYYSYI